LSETQVQSLYQSATLLLNLHGGTTPLPEHVATGRLVYLGTDPVVREIELHQQVAETIELFEQHDMLFTWGENYGQPDCGIPVSTRFRFCRRGSRSSSSSGSRCSSSPRMPSPPSRDGSSCGATSRLNGELYRWSKHFEFMKFLDLPSRTSQTLELALAGCNDEDRRMLEQHGWRIATRRKSRTTSIPIASTSAARAPSSRSRRTRTSACAAAGSATAAPRISPRAARGHAGHGLRHVLPTGRGLFGFSTLDEAVAAVDAINADYQSHSRAAAELARAYFDSDLVLTRLLKDCGV
jgi:hypothetical protein